MGLKKQEARKQFLTVSDGQLVLQHKEAKEGITKSRINKNLKEVHEEFFRSLEGFIAGIRSKDTDFGKVWEVTMTDGDEEFVISWNYSSRYTNNFFRLLPNVDFSRAVVFSPWMMKDKQDATKKVIGISLYQGKDKIAFAYTKENPGAWPEMVQVKRKGKLEWDDTDQLEYCEQMAEEINEQLKDRVVTVAPPAETAPTAAGNTADEADDDLPF